MPAEENWSVVQQLHPWPTALTNVPAMSPHSHHAETAWNAYVNGAEPTVLSSGEASTPSADVVYQITLEDPLVVVPVEVVSPGAYAFLLENGAGEVSTALVSSSGVVVDASAEEREEEDGGDEEGGDATGSKWVQGIVASLVVSLCRSVNFAVECTNKVVLTPKVIISDPREALSGGLLEAYGVLLCGIGRTPSPHLPAPLT